MKILITGATGFIGRSLSERLIEKGHEVFALTRNPSKKYERNMVYLVWNGITIENIPAGIEAVVNLAGESIFSLRWTGGKKEKIILSRVNSGKALCNAVKNKLISPRLLIQASAVGYYGDSNDEQDESSPSGRMFLSRVTGTWEESTKEVENYGVRRCIVRLGIVLGKGGMLSKIIPLFRMYMGGVIGCKEKWVSWIHIDDAVNAIIFLIEKENAVGVYNLTSPNPVRNADFYKKISEVLKKPCWLNVPEFLLRILMGEVAEELLLRNQRIIPRRLLKEGYRFIYPELKKALESIV